MAAALVVLQLLVAAAVLLLNTRWSAGAAVADRLQLATSRQATSAGEKLTVGGAWLWVALLLGLPLAALVERSFANRSGGYSLAAYRGLLKAARGADGWLFVAPIEALWNSLSTAALSTAVAVVVGVLAALALAYLKGVPARLLDLALLLPLGTSAAAVGFGMLVALDTDPVNWRFSWWLVPVTHALVSVPFVLRGVAPTLRAISPDVRDSAKLLGASQLQLFRSIDLPLARKAVLGSAGFAFAVSLGEFGASVFLVRPDRPTVPVVIYRLISRPGELAYGQALALSVILMLIIAAIVLVLERLKIPAGAGI